MKPDYAVFVEGTDEVAAKYASILAISLAAIKQYYDEKYDRNNFIKNVVLDNVLPGDILVKALLNEREVTLPVPATSTPYYYKWNDLRKYWSDKLAKFAQ
jgi:hypothetical protein